MNFEYDKTDLEHAEVMDRLACICRSNKSGFKEGETDRIDAIRELLKCTDYHEILLPHVQIWRKDLSSPIDVVVSSHVDTVNYITKCFSKLSEDGYYKGTYDNAGTNSAAVIAMLDGDIPANVIFAFTADEETGRCNGAKQTLEYVRNLGNDPLFIVLDVTYEGYDDGNIFTIENLSSGHKKSENMDFLNEAAKAALSLEPENIRTCTFVKMHKNAIPSIFPKEYLAKASGMFDEAFAYVGEHAKGFSLCLPCEGNMHGNCGVSVRQPSFEGYVNILESILYFFTKTHETLIDAKRIENATIITRLIDMLKEETEAEKSSKNKAASYGTYDELYGNYYYYDEPDQTSVYDDYYADYYGGFSEDDPLGEIIDELYEANGGYEAGQKQLYIDDMMEFIPYHVFESYDTTTIYDLLGKMFDSAHGIDIESLSLKDRMRYDEDGYEYDCSFFPDEESENEVHCKTGVTPVTWKDELGHDRDYDIREDFDDDYDDYD